MTPDKQRHNEIVIPNMMSPAHLAKKWSSVIQSDMLTQVGDDSPGKCREENKDEKRHFLKSFATAETVPKEVVLSFNKKRKKGKVDTYEPSHLFWEIKAITLNK